jgi:hypothetical protein
MNEPTPLRRTGRRPAQSAIHKSVIDATQSWHGRTLRVQLSSELLRTYAALAAHRQELAAISHHAPRLLSNLETELQGRGLL